MREGRELYTFGEYRLDATSRTLFRHDAAVPLAPKHIDTLIALVRARGAVVEREELLRQVWPDSFVEDAGISRNISTLRKVLEERTPDLAYIETLPKRGYRFAVPIRDGAVKIERPLERLIVLPFRMLKSDPDVEFLAFSLPDALTAALSALDCVIVRSTLVATRFGNAPDLSRLAQDASVDLVVSGNILRAGAAVRVSSQLADASTGAVIWSFTTQAPVDDLFRLQDALVEKIVGSLARPLSAENRRRLHHDVPSNAAAYELFLRANQVMPTTALSTERVIAARDLYLRSIDADPAYAPSWARLARVYRLLGKFPAGDSGANLAAADEALDRALALNPELAMAHNLYAQIDVERGRSRDAMRRLLTRLRATGPNAEICAGLVHACRFSGLLDESLAAHGFAQRIDPAQPTSVMHTYFVMRRYRDVVAVSGDVRGYIYALSLAALGRGDEAVAMIREFESRGEKLFDLFVAARALIEGNAREAVAALQRTADSSTDPEAFFYIARQFAFHGHVEAALSALATSVDGGYTCAFALADDPWFDGVRDMAEFREVVERANANLVAARAVFAECGGPELLAG